jgi:hypothetical protein
MEKNKKDKKFGDVIKKIIKSREWMKNNITKGRRIGN